MRPPPAAARLACLIALSLAMGACRGDDDDEGPLMLPGEACLRCHARGGAEDAPAFTAAGTVFARPDDPATAGLAGATVAITGADGRVVTLATNAAGNFYTRDPIALPASVEVRRGADVQRMKLPLASGDCSSCHAQPPKNDAPGRTWIGP